MSAEMPGFIETSNNIGILELKENGLFIISNHRSSVLSRLAEITNRVTSLAGRRKHRADKGISTLAAEHGFYVAEKVR